MANVLSAGFEDGTVGGWAGDNGATVSNSLEQAQAGTRSLKIVSSAANAAEAWIGSIAISGGTATLVLSIRPTITTSFYIYMNINKSGGGVIFNLEPTGGGFVTSVPANAWTTLTRTLAIPSDAVSARLGISMTATAAAQAWYLDAVSLDANQAPTVNAGVDQSVVVGSLVTLTATATDPDGTIASYSWSQTSGPAATLSGTGASRTFTPTVSGAYVFSVTATDNGGATSATDAVTVTASAAAAGPVKFIRVADAWSRRKYQTRNAGNTAWTWS